MIDFRADGVLPVVGGLSDLSLPPLLVITDGLLIRARARFLLGLSPSGKDASFVCAGVRVRCEAAEPFVLRSSAEALDLRM